MTTGCYFFPLTLERDVEIVVEESVHYVQGDPTSGKWYFNNYPIKQLNFRKFSTYLDYHYVSVTPP